MSTRHPTQRKRDILRRNPYTERRGFIARAMALVEGDGLETSLTESETITWSTATEWDNRVSQDPNVIHELIGDISADDELRLGYSASDFGGNSSKPITLHNDDASGDLENAGPTSNFTTPDSPTYEVTGVWGTQAVSCDGSDLFYQNSDTEAEGGGQYTLFAWVKFDSLSGIQRIISHQGQATGNDTVLTLRTDGSNIEVLARDAANGNLAQATGSTSLLTDEWYALAGIVDAANNEVRAYIDGSEDAADTSTTLSTNSADWSADSDPYSWMGFRRPDNSDQVFVPGDGDWAQVWTRDVGATAVADLSSLTGQLETATKSMSSQAQPDLTNLDYALNGENLEIEAIGSPGTASEEVVTSGNLDGTQTSATLSWSSSHTDFRIRPILKTTKPPTSSPVLRAASLTS